MESLGTLLFIALLVFAAFLTWASFHLVHWLEPLDHERYNGVDVYAVDSDGTRWHVQKGLLSLYMDIKSPRIKALTGQPGGKICEILLWTMTLGIPAAFAPLVRKLWGK